MTQKNNKSANEIDKYVGQRLRMRRCLLDMTQGTLANSVGVTFQQIQKYERGTNRISAGRLFQFGDILGVSVSYFYPDTETPDFICIEPDRDSLAFARKYQRLKQECTPAAKAIHIIFDEMLR